MVWCEGRRRRARGRGSEEKNGYWNWLHGRYLRAWGKEPGRPRLTRPRPERVRVKENHHLPANIMFDEGTYFIWCDFSLINVVLGKRICQHV